MTPEGKIKARVDKLLHQYKIWFFSPQAGPYGKAGIPDRIAIIRGQFVGIEVKADRTKKPTALQRKCMEKIEAAGGKCFVVCDFETLEQLERYINAGSSKREGVALEAEQPKPGT